jgi:hypothetical protein
MVNANDSAKHDPSADMVECANGYAYGTDIQAKAVAPPIVNALNSFVIASINTAPNVTHCLC